MMNGFWKKAAAVTTALCLAAGFVIMPAIRAQAKENIVVCIDPGHGGSNGGANYNGLWEKDLTLQIAAYMYQELSQYEGITVVMTRVDDRDLSLKERADIAAAAGADFLFSIHLNASPDHNLFGSEVWVSGYGNYYAKGMSFGNILLREWGEDLGIYSRGSKTKLNTNGGDYYGVINYARLNGVTAAILEHCHMDEAHDEDFYMAKGALEKLGRADATAVAKYYGLKSAALGTDYSGYQYLVYPKADTPHMQDLTAPEVSEITLTGYEESTNKVWLHVKALDAESRIIYYSYSGDGGLTWSNLWGWAPAGEGDITITLPKNSTGEICVRVWNEYNGFTESNHVFIK